MAPPSDLPDPSTRPSRPPLHRPDDESNVDRQTHVVGMMVGTALMFIGFLDVFLSISGGFEINVVPLLIYFSGIAVWANACLLYTSRRGEPAGSEAAILRTPSQCSLVTIVRDDTTAWNGPDSAGRNHPSC